MIVNFFIFILTFAVIALKNACAHDSVQFGIRRSVMCGVCKVWSIAIHCLAIAFGFCFVDFIVESEDGHCHHVFNLIDSSMAHFSDHHVQAITHFPRMNRLCGANIANERLNERMHVQYTFQLDLEVNSKQIERRLFRLPFHILYLIILLICLNLFDLSMKSILFSGIYERIILFDSIALQPYVHVYSIYLYK